MRRMDVCAFESHRWRSNKITWPFRVPRSFRREKKLRQRRAVSPAPLHSAAGNPHPLVPRPRPPVSPHTSRTRGIAAPRTLTRKLGGGVDDRSLSLSFPNEPDTCGLRPRSAPGPSACPRAKHLSRHLHPRPFLGVSPIPSLSAPRIDLSWDTLSPPL